MKCEICLAATIYLHKTQVLIQGWKINMIDVLTADNTSLEDQGVALTLLQSLRSFSFSSWGKFSSRKCFPKQQVGAVVAREAQGRAGAPKYKLGKIQTCKSGEMNPGPQLLSPGLCQNAGGLFNIIPLPFCSF